MHQNHHDVRNRRVDVVYSIECCNDCHHDLSGGRILRQEKKDDKGRRRRK